MYSGVLKWAVTTFMKHGLYAVYCGSPVFEEDFDLMWWENLFTATKYYELLDTVFLVIEKKPLSFLHVWHHASVIPMCWFATHQSIVMVKKNQSIQNVPTIFFQRDGSLLSTTAEYIF